MKIEITANKPLVKYYLKNLKDEIFYFTNNEEFDLPPGWYNFILEYTGENIELTSIKVNDEDLRQYFYAGFFTEKATGKRLQPASAVWTEGYYSIWLHTEFGHLESFYMDNIRFLTVLQSRHGGQGVKAALYFNGAVNFFSELPKINTPAEEAIRKNIIQLRKNEFT